MRGESGLSRAGVPRGTSGVRVKRRTAPKRNTTRLRTRIAKVSAGYVWVAQWDRRLIAMGRPYAKDYDAYADFLVFALAVAKAFKDA